MKSIINFILLSILFLFNSNDLSGQKPNIDTSIFGKWPSVYNPKISNNGRFASFNIDNSPVGSSSIVVRGLFNSWQKIIGGNYSDLGEFPFSSDSRFFAVSNSNDSLVLIELGSENRRYISHVKSYKLFNNKESQWLVYQLDDSSRQLVLLNLYTSIQRSWNNVSDFVFNKQGSFLVIETQEHISLLSYNSLRIINLQTLKETEFWNGDTSYNFVFDNRGTSLAFMSVTNFGKTKDTCLSYYKLGSNDYKIIFDDDSKIEGDLAVVGIQKFNYEGDKIFIDIRSRSQIKTNYSPSFFDLWSYKDEKIRFNQIQDNSHINIYKASLEIDKHKILRLEVDHENLYDFSNIDASKNDSFALIIRTNNDIREWNWNSKAYISCYVVSLLDGSRKIVTSNVSKSGISYYKLSPDGRYVVFYDPKKNNYFSYSISTGKTINITKNIPANWTTWAQNDLPKFSQGPLGVASWIKGSSKFIAYDQFDLFELDLLGKNPPNNLTHGYGRKHNIVFRLAINNSNYLDSNCTSIFLNAFDRNNKNDGFFSLNLKTGGNPQKLILEPCIFKGPDESEFVTFVSPIKAADTTIYLVRKMSATSSPNYFWTSDFVNFYDISNVHPEYNYNWLSTQLITWKTINGSKSQGILYKPENFDPTKKYPLIINYYEKLSEGLNAYISPDYSDGSINIPFFVSKGYLVFSPDINFKVGDPGESVLNSVVSGALFLSNFPFIDKTKIGIQGHSRGGFETNYLITHTGLFAAAVSACGMSDYISLYLGINQFGEARSPGFELYSQRIGNTLWERPDLYIKNSPILRANRVITPVLIMANRLDPDVPYLQGLEFFLALRRLNKRAWLLQYNNEGHILHTLDSRKDYSIRMLEFFDYFLNHKGPPNWISQEPLHFNQ